MKTNTDTDNASCTSGTSPPTSTVSGTGFVDVARAKDELLQTGTQSSGADVEKLLTLMAGTHDCAVLLLGVRGAVVVILDVDMFSQFAEHVVEPMDGEEPSFISPYIARLIVERALADKVRETDLIEFMLFAVEDGSTLMYPIRDLPTLLKLGHGR